MEIPLNDAEVLEEVFDEVRYDYSGRSMFGAECIGIVVDDNSWAAELYALRDAYEGDADIEDFLTYMLETQPESPSGP